MCSAQCTSCTCSRESVCAVQIVYLQLRKRMCSAHRVLAVEKAYVQCTSCTCSRESVCAVHIVYLGGGGGGFTTLNYTIHKKRQKCSVKQCSSV